MRWANRSTASGSSLAPSTASASSEMPPTGVFSSWLTFATKSRRISSTRRAWVWSSARISTCETAIGATRTRITTDAVVFGLRVSSSSASRIMPSRRTCRARWRSSWWTSSPCRTSP